MARHNLPPSVDSGCVLGNAQTGHEADIGASQGLDSSLLASANSLGAFARALEDGRKSQFRFVIDPQPRVILAGTDRHGTWDCDDGVWAWWGREADGFHRIHSTKHVCPLAVGSDVRFGSQTINVSAIGIQRLHDICEDAAFAEGVESPRTGPSECGEPAEAVYEFMRVWVASNGGDSWQANPWVWVVSFKRCDISATSEDQSTNPATPHMSEATSLPATTQDDISLYGEGK